MKEDVRIEDIIVFSMVSWVSIKCSDKLI